MALPNQDPALANTINSPVERAEARIYGDIKTIQELGRLAKQMHELTNELGTLQSQGDTFYNVRAALKSLQMALYGHGASLRQLADNRVAVEYVAMDLFPDHYTEGE